MQDEQAIKSTTSNALRTNGSNGAADLSVHRTRRPTRAEVESKLASTSDSIAERVDALRNEITGSGKGVARAFKENAWLGLGVALLGGAVTGFVLTPSARKRRASLAGTIEPQRPQKRHPILEAAGLAVLNLAIKEVSKRLTRNRE